MIQTTSKTLVIDSSVLILFLNDALPEPSVSLLAESLQAGQALISSIVRAEVLAWPGHTAVSLVSATCLLDVCKLVPVDGPVADEAARIRRETGLKLPDALIAATAVRESAALVTANGKYFRRVPGLVLIEV